MCQDFQPEDESFTVKPRIIVKLKETIYEKNIHMEGLLLLTYQLEPNLNLWQFNNFDPSYMVIQAYDNTKYQNTTKYYNNLTSKYQLLKI